MDSQPEGAPERNDRLPQSTFLLSLVVILIFAGVCYVVAVLTNPILERAEIYFAESAREMIASARYVTPYYLGQPFFDKPVWAYWMIVASLRIFGFSFLAARVPSVLAALATILLTACGIAHIRGRRAGLAAAAVLCSSFIFFYLATLAMSDMWLTLFCSATAALLFSGSSDPARRTLYWWLAAVSSGLAVLTKGPIGVVLPVAAFLLYLLFAGELRQIRLRHIVLGLVTVAVVAGSWFTWLWRDNGGSSFYAFFVVENIRRFTGAAYQTRRSLTYIPVALLTDFAPWSAFLPFALWQSLRHRRASPRSVETRGELFLCCYAAVVTGFFWISRFQLEYYLLPAIPACAALTGIYLDRTLANERTTRKADVPMRLIAWLLGAVLLVAGGRGFFLARAAGQTGWHDLWLPTLWLYLCGSAMLLFLAFGKPAPALVTLALALCGVLALGSQAEFSLYRRAVGIADLAAATQQPAGALQLPIAVAPDLGDWRGELAFRTGRIPAQLDTPDDLAAFLRAPGPREAIVGNDWLAGLPPDISGRARVIFTGPVLVQKVTRAALLDPNVLTRYTKTFSVLATVPGDPEPR